MWRSQAGIGELVLRYGLRHVNYGYRGIMDYLVRHQTLDSTDEDVHRTVVVEFLYK